QQLVMEHADTTADVQERRCGWEVRLQPAEQERSSRERASPTVTAEISCGPFRPKLLVEHLRPTTAHCALHDVRPVRLTRIRLHPAPQSHNPPRIQRSPNVRYNPPSPA